MVPIVVLVGRQNVGKSTLFNRLTKTRDALVTNFSGLTRDRNYGYTIFQGYEFIVIDTGGMNCDKNNISNCIENQLFQAIKESDVILFIVDSREGLIPLDRDIAKYLHKQKKTTFLVVNKINGLNFNVAISEFHILGLNKIFAISATHSYGIKELVHNIVILFFPEKAIVKHTKKLSNISKFLKEETINFKQKENKEKDKNYSENLPIRLAVVGCPNAGKSTLINCILNENRVIIHHLPGTTRDSIRIPMVHKDNKYILVDTAGIRKFNKINNTVEKFSTIKTLQEIKNSNIIILTIDAYVGLSKQDLALLSFVIKSGRSLIIAINKWDTLNKEKRIYVKNILTIRLKFAHFIPLHFVSAINGSGINNLLESVFKSYKCSINHINTSMITKIMKIAVKEHQPPVFRGRRIKLKYAHSGGYNPLLIVIHGNQVTCLSNSYKHYLTNCFRRSLKMSGTPIQIQFKESHNPFSDKNHVLTLRKIHKRHR
ncbi:GTPase Der [Candidatus Ecksteinia adelgidicola]|nr:GTPase Der [Candidatus Ecksteinia adelgidicola]